jgi:hypothetical protein
MAKEVQAAPVQIQAAVQSAPIAKEVQAAPVQIQAAVQSAPIQARTYINPDPRAENATLRPRRVRPKQPTGRYLAKEPLEFPVLNADGTPIRKADGTLSDARKRVEVDQVLPTGIGITEEQIAILEDKGLVEAEFTEVAE